MQSMNPWTQTKTLRPSPEDELLMEILAEQSKRSPAGQPVYGPAPSPRPEITQTPMMADLGPPQATGIEPEGARGQTPGDYFGNKALAQGLLTQLDQPSQLTPKAPGSGLQENQGAQNKFQTRGQLIQNTLLTPEQINAEYDAYSKLAPFQEQARGIADMESLLAMEANRTPQMDLTSLAAAADYAAGPGGTALKGYRAPDRNKLSTIVALQDKLQDNRRDRTKSIIDAIRASKSGTYMNAYTLEQLQKMGLLAQDPKMKGSGGAVDQEIKWADTLQSKIGRDTQITKSHDQLTAARAAIKLLQQGMSVTDETFKPLWARATGQAPLSNLDIAKITGSTDLADKLEQVVETLTSGKFTDANRKSYVQAAQAIHDLHTRVIEQRKKHWLTQATNTYKFSPQKAQELVESNFLDLGVAPVDPTKPGAPKPKAGGKAAPKRPAAMAKDPKGWTPAERAEAEAYLKALNGGK